MKKTVGENLKMFRIKKGLSMEEAGKKIGVSAPAILKYERNKIIASLERLEEFAKIYNTTIDDILNIETSINIKYDNIFFKEKTSNIKKENIKNYINNKIENYSNLSCSSSIRRNFRSVLLKLASSRRSGLRCLVRSRDCSLLHFSTLA